MLGKGDTVGSLPSPAWYQQYLVASTISAPVLPRPPMALRADTNYTASLQICWCPLSFLQPSIVFAAAVTAAHVGEIPGTKRSVLGENKR